MKPSTKTGIAVAGGLGAIVATGVAYGSIVKCNGVTLELSGSTSAQPDVQETYTVSVMQGSTPVTNQDITLVENTTQSLQSDSTDSSGNVSFLVNFSSAGIYSLTASMKCGLSTLTSNPLMVEVQGGAGGGSCPSGEVAADSDGSCPPNSFPDSYNPGCCIPCSQLIPYSIVLNSIDPVSLYYYANVQDGTIHPSCPSCIKGCSTNFNYNPDSITVTGRLVDSAGHGICGQLINLTVANNGEGVADVSYSVSVISPIFSAKVETAWGIHVDGASGYTDQDGSFSIALPVAVSLLSLNETSTPPDAPIVPACYVGDPLVSPLGNLVTASLPGTTISGVGSAVVNLEAFLSQPL